MSEHMLWETIDEQKRKIAELEETNAELNKKLSKAEADYDKMFWNKNEIISKAKELLKATLLMAQVEGLKGRYETVDEIEQFLKEIKK